MVKTIAVQATESAITFSPPRARKLSQKLDLSYQLFASNFSSSLVKQAAAKLAKEKDKGGGKSGGKGKAKGKKDKESMPTCKPNAFSGLLSLYVGFVHDAVILRCCHQLHVFNKFPSNH